MRGGGREGGREGGKEGDRERERDTERGTRLASSKANRQTDTVGEQGEAERGRERERKRGRWPRNNVDHAGGITSPLSLKLSPFPPPTSVFPPSMLSTSTGVNVGIPVPREPFAFGGLSGTLSKYGDFDVTAEGAMEFFTNRRKVGGEGGHHEHEFPQDK